MPPVRPAIPTTNGVHHAEDATEPTIKAFSFHGMDLRSLGSEQSSADCPFCGKEGKFFLHEVKGTWDCKVCGEKGNLYSFLRLLHRDSMAATKDADREELARERKLIDPETLTAWGVCKSTLTAEWLVPGYGVDGKLNQLSRYVLDPKTKKRRLYGTPTCKQQLFGASPTLYDAKKADLYLCEGVWDAMALWEMLGKVKRVEGAVSLTAAESMSMRAFANVLAVPGCQTFNEKWASVCEGKRVHLLYDSDHPRQANGKTIDPAGWLGMRKVAATLATSEHRPESVHWLAWGPDGFDPTLPSGTDLRDLLTSGDAETGMDRVPNLARVLERIEPIPDSWIAGKDKKAAKGKMEIAALPCSDWRTLVNAWRKAMRWNEGLDRALSVMLASLASTNSIGEQLWVRVLAPPSTGKSTLAEALSANTRHVVAKSTIRGFHSGFQTDADAKEDYSLLSKLNGKTLITKDGDTLLQSPNLPQILSEARDVYDRVSRTSYRNKASRDYLGISMTWILLGTAALRSLDTSELGERFLTCAIMDGVDEDEEREIVMKVLHRQSRVKGTSVNDAQSLADPDMTKAMQLTSGYVDHLGKWANPLLQEIDDTEDQLGELAHLAVFISYLRARPSIRQIETVERELAARLASQLHRLATCLAVVLNRKTLDEEVMRRVKRVAMDTAKGRTLDIVTILARYGEDGLDAKSLSLLTAQTEAEERTFLKFLKRLRAVEAFTPPAQHGIRAHVKWRLSPRLAELYGEVCGAREEVES